MPCRKLHVVDDQKVDVAKRLLEGQRIVVADRGGKAPHEVFRRQVNDPEGARIAHGSVGDRLQHVRLAETDARMQEKRVEAHGTGAGFRDGFGCGQRDTV